ncbi:helix-turn-helix domain-containing protein [Variovorax ginsengisoli]|uniref:helix-turn-helix domain-containing protein n=1 Tax=Variovorax ginsengisoli TaxID=363844 RepID=UPI0034551DB6
MRRAAAPFDAARFGACLKQRRLARSLTLQELSAQTGFSVTSLSEMETAKSPPSRRPPASAKRSACASPVCCWMPSDKLLRPVPRTESVEKESPHGPRPLAHPRPCRSPHEGRVPGARMGREPRAPRQ